MLTLYLDEVIQQSNSFIWWI